MTGQLRIIKIGGAAITDKSVLEKLNEQVLQNTCSSLSKSCGGVDRPAVIVHGAGSFGHHTASSAGVSKGGLDSLTVRCGFVDTRLSVTKLNHLVVECLRSAGMLACGVSPLGSWRTAGQQVVLDGCDVVRRLIEAGLTPVLHGDVVLDDEQGCTILSGDVIMSTLAAKLSPQYAVFLTDVDGVYDIPPHEPGARLLQNIVVYEEIKQRFAGSPTRASLTVLVGRGNMDGRWIAHGLEGVARMSTHAQDVTGGMAGKISEAARIAVLGIPVLIARAGSASATLACEHGPRVLDLPDVQWVGTIVQKAAGGEATPQ